MNHLVYYMLFIRFYLFVFIIVLLYNVTFIQEHVNIVINFHFIFNNAVMFPLKKKTELSYL